MTEFCQKFIGPPGKKLFNCGACYKVSVDAYGKLQPCLLLRSPDVVYDLKNGNLKKAMTQFFPEVLKTEAVNSKYLQQCSRCFLKGLCLQCPAKSWSEHGTLDTPVDYLCSIAHVQARYLGLLKKNEYAWDVTNWKERIKNLEEKNEQH